MPGPLILDRYKPLSTAGKGGSGTVQICWDTRIQRRVAIKRIAIPESSPDGTIPGLSEARTGAMLKHPNIASVIDFETSGQEAFLIMEAIEGPSLSQVIDGTHKSELDLDIIAAVTESVAEALDFAHENAVLHLDIKPDNILIDASGIVKVTDFGISELSGAEGFSQASGGTIGYMPPEQVNGDDLDQRTDGFALAVVIYEMLTGTNPYNARDVNGSLRRMEEGELAPVSRMRVDTPPELDEIMASAMSPLPEERFETVLEMVDEIMPFLGDVSEGKRKLQALMDDEEEAQEEVVHLRPDDVWGRVSPRARSLAGRTCGAILCWWTAALGFTAMGILKTEFAMLFAVAVGALGALLPGIGALAAMAFLGSGVIVNSALPTWLGIAVIVLATLWWGAAGRHRMAAANVTLAMPPLSLIWCTPFVPMLAGFTLRPLPAAACTLMQGVLGVALGTITATGSIQHSILVFVNGDIPLPLGEMLANPATWITWASWILVAVCLSTLCSRQSRVLSIVSAFVGCALLMGGQLLAIYVTTGAWLVPRFRILAGIAAATVAMVIIGAMGAPYRYKEEE